MGTIIRYREICIHVDNIPLHVHDSGKWDIPADAWILVGCVLQFYFPNISLLDPLEGLILIVVTMPNKLMFPAPRRSWTRCIQQKLRLQAISRYADGTGQLWVQIQANFLLELHSIVDMGIFSWSFAVDASNNLCEIRQFLGCIWKLVKPHGFHPLWENYHQQLPVGVNLAWGWPELRWERLKHTKEVICKEVREPIMAVSYRATEEDVANGAIEFLYQL